MGKFKCKLGKPCSLGEASSPAHRGQCLNITAGGLILSYRRQQGQRRGESREQATRTHQPRHMYTRAHTERMLVSLRTRNCRSQPHLRTSQHPESVLTPQAAVPGRGPGVRAIQQLVSVPFS